MTDEREDGVSPKLKIIRGDAEPEDVTKEEEEKPKDVEADEILDENGNPVVIPTVATQAIRVVHPIFMTEQGQPLPPPPDHEFRVGFTVSIAPKHQVVQETQNTFFVSGDDIDEIAEKVKEIVLQGLNQVKREMSPIQEVGADALQVLERVQQEQRNE